MSRSRDQQSELKNIYKETKSYTKKLDKDTTRKMIKDTVAMRSLRSGELFQFSTQSRITQPSLVQTPKVQTQYQVINQDTFIAAKELVSEGLNPLVMNMANRISIGGAVEEGAAAQEETLFRCSNYHEALYPHGIPNGQRIVYPHNRLIHEYGSYYTPNIQVVRDATQHYKFIEPFTVACIAIAGYDLGKPHLLEKDLKDKNGNIILSEFKEHTKRKIRHVLEVALYHGHDSLVLGAISCGAFKLRNDNQGITATAVAEAYAEVLQESAYQNKFKNITFAVYDTQLTPVSNFNVFKKKLASFTQAKQPLKQQTAASSSSTSSHSVQTDYDRIFNIYGVKSIESVFDNEGKENMRLIFNNERDAGEFVVHLHHNLSIGSSTHKGQLKKITQDPKTKLFHVYLSTAQWKKLPIVHNDFLDNGSRNMSASSSSSVPAQPSVKNNNFQKEFLKHYKPGFFGIGKGRVGRYLEESKQPLTREKAIEFAEEDPNSAVAKALTAMNIKFKK
ncbi:MAG: TIGR02452 family protein [Gammaproteobacteria bacterium]|nr:TIGR02452 family protein [Gammaproteobacteria bacterium]